MKRSFRDAWVKDLEENQNLYCSGQLRDENKYCAMGRACVISNIPINERGTDCVDADGNVLDWKPLEDLGINTRIVMELNDNHSNYNYVISYLKTLPVED